MSNSTEVMAWFSTSEKAVTNDAVETTAAPAMMGFFSTDSSTESPGRAAVEGSSSSNPTLSPTLSFTTDDSDNITAFSSDHSTYTDPLQTTAANYLDNITSLTSNPTSDFSIFPPTDGSVQSASVSGLTTTLEGQTSSATTPPSTEGPLISFSSSLTTDYAITGSIPSILPTDITTAETPGDSNQALVIGLAVGLGGLAIIVAVIVAVVVCQKRKGKR